MKKILWNALPLLYRQFRYPLPFVKAVDVVGLVSRNRWQNYENILIPRLCVVHDIFFLTFRVWKPSRYKMLKILCKIENPCKKPILGRKKAVRNVPNGHAIR